jgi:hypothetical protein
MRARRSIAIPIIALTIGVSVLVAALTARNHECYARSRFKIDIKETHRWPDLYGADANSLRLLLDSREGHQVLAKASMVDESAFALRKIAPIRGTALGCLEYSGANSNIVECVASNAVRIVVSFYATNQPNWEVTYIDSYCFTPFSVGDWLKQFFGF